MANQTATTIGPYVGSTDIAYFTMEIALRPEMHTYSGGSGCWRATRPAPAPISSCRSSSCTLINRQGYLRQEIDGNGDQIEHPDPWTPEDYATPLRAKVACLIEGREVWVRPWLHVLASGPGLDVPVLLLDTDLHENAPEDRRITDTLYGGDQTYRLKQEIVLGIGGVRMLQALGFNIRRYHMNEGHAALLALDLLRRHPRPADEVAPGQLRYNVEPVRERCVFTTHTPVEAGHDRFPFSMMEHLLEGYIDTEQVKIIAGEDELNMTRLALNLSDFVNGVASRHARDDHADVPGLQDPRHLQRRASADLGP